MNHTRFLSAVLLSILGAGLPAQSASSGSWFLVTGEQLPGGRSASTTYVLRAGGIGAPLGGTATTSRGFELRSGFVASLDQAPGGRPWLTGVQPKHVMPKPGITMTLAGSHLHLGSGAAVTIGGRSATILTRAADRITVRLPAQPVPGWQAVTLTTSAGAATLPDSVGVAPMMHVDRGPAPNKTFNLVFRATQGDQVILAAGALPIAPIPIPGIRYGLGLHPAAMVVLTGFSILPPSGVMSLPIAAAPWASPIYVQAAVSTTNPNYGPASFTNVLVF